MFEVFDLIGDGKLTFYFSLLGFLCRCSVKLKKQANAARKKKTKQSRYLARSIGIHSLL